MIEFKLQLGRLDEGVTGPASFQAGADVENTEDEANILGDQDQTDSGLPDAHDENMGGMGTGEFGLEQGRFARGEIDLVDQMQRTTTAMDGVNHRRDDDVFPGYDTASEIDTAAVAQDSVNNHKPGEDETITHPRTSGHETGAFTDVGAGRSGVTRQH